MKREVKVKPILEGMAFDNNKKYFWFCTLQSEHLQETKEN